MTFLSEDETMRDMYRRLQDEGWRPAALSLTSMVSDSKAFEQGNERLSFSAHGGLVAVQMTRGGSPVMAVNGLSTESLNALLDILGILSTSDEWMAWYRSQLWEAIVVPS